MVAAVEVQDYPAVNWTVDVEEPTAAVGLVEVRTVTEVEEQPTGRTGRRGDQGRLLAVVLEQRPARDRGVGHLTERVDDLDRLTFQGLEELGVDDPCLVELVPSYVAQAVALGREARIVDPDAVPVAATDEVHAQRLDIRGILPGHHEHAHAVRRSWLLQRVSAQREATRERSDDDLLAVQ